MEPPPRTPLWDWSLSARRIMMAVVAGLAMGMVDLHTILGRRGSPTDARLVVDPNTAPPGVLDTLPRLGPALVARIIDEREAEPFRSLDDMDRRVRGIGPATAQSLRPFFRFEPPAIGGAPGTVEEVN